MTTAIVKLRKGKTEFDWDKLIAPDCKRLEIISPSLTQLPDMFDKAPLLESLEIHCPELTSLPPSFFNNTNLALLKIKNSLSIDLSGEAAFTNLKTLQLAKLKIVELPNWIQNSIQLEVIDLHGNNLNDLPDFFKTFSKLKRLNLDSNNYTTLPWELEELNSLTHLSLDNNSFDEQEKQRIHKVFKISF